MNAVFADTYYFLGLVSRKDKAHSKCVEFSNSSNRSIITTEWVLMELGDALCRGRDREVFALLLHDLAQDDDAVAVPADADLFQKGVALFRPRTDKQWSLTDCTSFVVMQEHGLTEALTSDHHFEQAGFTALLVD